MKKTVKIGSTYLLSKDQTENPKLGAKVLANGKDSLYLDYYYGYKNVYDEATDTYKPVKNRQRTFLRLYLWQTPRNNMEKQENKDVIALAKRIRFEKEQELQKNLRGYRVEKQTDIDFLEYFQSYIDCYTKKDYRMMVIALQRFKDFLASSKKYNMFTHGIKFRMLNRDMMLAFVEYLQAHSVGEGAKSIFQRFKKVIKYAHEHEIITKNPCAGITIMVDENALRKDVLSEEEITLLYKTHYKNESPNIRNAFLFCLLTGLRFCDVNDLTYRNIDYGNMLLKFDQNKTKNHSTNSYVTTPINETILSLVGPVSDNLDGRIFNLPSYEACLKAVKRWVGRAGIKKHISWHCARHSFATNILSKGANIKTVASLLGHSGLKYTDKYVRAVDASKAIAVNSLSCCLA